MAVAAGLVATAAASYGLSPVLGILGVTLGIAAGNLAFAMVLVTALRQAGLWRFDAALPGRLGRTALASALLGMALVAGTRILPTSATSLSALCCGGLGFYAGAGWLLGALTPADLRLLAKNT
jgi:hypothetical protein